MALTREQDRLRQRLRRAALTVEQQEDERRKARERMRRTPDRRKRAGRSRAKPGAMSPSEKGRLGSRARWADHMPVVHDPVPSDVRYAYGRAHPNSAIRRLCPTWADLKKNWPINQPPKGT